MTRWKLFVLGPPRLERDGQPVTPSLRKALALLVYLAVTGQPQSRDTLAALLWPKSDQQEARGRLRRTLHRLGEVLGDEVLAVSADTLGIAPGSDLWVDSHTFGRHATSGLAAKAAADVHDPERLSHLTQAADLYTDEFMAGFTLADSPAFDDWQFFQREGLRQTFVQVLERLVQAHCSREAWDEAIGYGRRLVALDPLDEAKHRVLMQLYADAGQPGAALRQYQECVRILDAELGEAPEDATTALFRRIRARRSSDTSAGLVLADSTPVEVPAVSAQSSARVATSEQSIRFCTTRDGVRTAYATAGQGPPFVKAANWLSHLEFDWQSPVWRHWLTELSREHTLVRYDERGCGLSDWDVDEMSLDAWVRDLEAVVDALALERFPLLGISGGGPVAVAYTVQHPEKVSHLILYGTYARGRFVRPSDPQEILKAKLLLQLMEVGWAQDNPAFRQLFTGMFIPDATLEQIRWFNDLQRLSASPENAVRIRTTNSHLDVQDIAPRVTVPTLVIHARDDAATPFAEGRHLATLIPGACFVALEGRNHILLETEPAWTRFLHEVRRFLAN